MMGGCRGTMMLAPAILMRCAAMTVAQSIAMANHVGAFPEEVEWLMDMRAPGELPDDAAKAQWTELAGMQKELNPPSRKRLQTVEKGPRTLKRRLQDEKNTEASSWASHSPDDIDRWGAHLGSIVPDQSGGTVTVGGERCTDDKASNGGQPGECVYDCDALKQHYFADEPDPDKVRCFNLKHDLDSLMSWRKSRRATHFYVQQSSAASLSWTVGDPTCTNVSISIVGSTTDVADEVTRACLFDGQHEHNVSHAPNSTIVIANTDTGDRTEVQLDEGFELGECTDVYIEMQVEPTPDVEDDERIVWELDDGAHQFDRVTIFNESMSDIRQAGHALRIDACLFDKDFTMTQTLPPELLNRVNVSVVGYVDDNSIYIPNDERWIINGHSMDGVPALLDARLATGTPTSRSNASIVLRHLRFSGQHGTLDPYVDKRGFSQRPESRMGCAFMYEGGFGAKVILDHVIYDHNGGASCSGGAMMFAGRGEDNNGWTANFDAESSDPQITDCNNGCGLTIEIHASLFWANSAYLINLRTVNILPLTFSLTDSQFLDNDGIVGDDIFLSWYHTIKNKTGTNNVTVQNTNFNHTSSCKAEETRNPFTDSQWCDVGVISLACWVTGGGSSLPDHVTDILVQEVRIDGYQNWFHSMLFFQNYGKWADGVWKTTLREVEVSNVRGTSDGNVYSNACTDWGGEGADTRILQSYFHDNRATVEASGNAGAAYAFFHDGSGEDTMVQIEQSEFVNNVAGVGGGAINYLGPGQMEIRYSRFTGNIAHGTGGAIGFHGSTRSLLVEHSAFVDNKIEAVDGQTVALFVRLHTGDMGEGKSWWPIWTIGEQIALDSSRGERHSQMQAGLRPWFGCNKQELVGGPVFEQDPWQRGELTETWENPSVYTSQSGTFCPSNELGQLYVRDGDFCRVADTGEICEMEPPVYGANETASRPVYQTTSDYSEVINVQPGSHRLWHGVLSKTAGPATGWTGGAWIDVKDAYSTVVDAVYPSIVDSRLSTTTTQYRLSTSGGYASHPGCYSSPLCDGPPVREVCNEQKSCPQNMKLWSYTDFSVAFGAGGAIATSGKNLVDLRNVTFDGNLGGAGSALSVAGAERVTVVGSHFLDGQDIQSSTAPDKCEADPPPCSLGQQCTYRAFSIHCDEPCAVNEYGNGRSCVTCGPGKQPNSTKSGCEVCPAAAAGTNGLCLPCKVGEVHNDGDGDHAAHTTCVQCDPGKMRTSGETCVLCPDGTTAAADRTSCERCPEPGQYTSGGQACSLCPAGKQPNDDGFDCVPCPPATVRSGDELGVCSPCSGLGEYARDGQSCEICPAGTRPFSNKTGCQICPAGEAGEPGTGRCTRCQPGLYATSGMPACLLCPGGMEPNDEKSACQCKSSTYDSSSIGLIECEGTASTANQNHINAACTPCPPCVDCNVAGYPALMEGWASFGDSDMRAFECPTKPACPRRSLNASEGGSFFDQSCNLGYDHNSPLCAMCASDPNPYNQYKVGTECVACADGRVNVPVVIFLGALALAATAAVIAGAYSWLVDNGLTTDLRILIGLYQILSQAETVLMIALPDPLPTIIQIARALFLDIRDVIHMDCIDMGGLYAKMITNVFVLPLLAAAACGVYYLNEKKMVDRLIREGVSDNTGLQSASMQLKRNLMMATFILYPTMTTTLFRVPMCRELGDQSYHEDDYWVNCESNSFLALQVVGAIGVLVVPIGIPLGFYFKMRTRVIELGGEANYNAAGGSKLVPDDADDETDQFSFLVQDYRPSCYYWEVVMYARRLALNGFTVVVGRGTRGQIYFCTLVSGGFLMAHLKSEPFVIPKHNLMEAIAEVTLIVMYMTCLLLRDVDEDAWTSEWVSKEGYGWFLAFLMIVICPAPFLYSLWHRLRSRDSARESERESTFGNPLSADADDSKTFASSQTAEQVMRSGKAQQRKVKGLAAELAKAKKEAVDAKAEAEKCKAEILSLTSSTDVGGQSSESAGSETQELHKFDTRRPSQVLAIKELVQEGVLSEESIGEATAALAEHLGTQIQSRKLYEKQERDKLEVMRRAHDAKVQSEQWLALEKDLHSMQKLSENAYKGRSSLHQFLDNARLVRHEQHFLDTCGRDLSASDLELVEEEDIEALKAPMTSVEKKRFDKALQAVLTDD